MFRVRKLLLSNFIVVFVLFLWCALAFSENAISKKPKKIKTHSTQSVVTINAPFTWHQLKHDYKNYYSTSNLSWLLGGFAVGAVIANSPIDQHIRNFYQEQLRSDGTDSVSQYAKIAGSPYVVLGYLGAWVAGNLIPESTTASVLGRWGNLSMRALAVGLPPMWLMQNVTGSYRPDENKNSYWHPFVEDHGVSGHAFMGAIPFLTAAECTDSTGLRYALYAGSTLAGLSRINDDEHYFSQVLLGWWMAHLAVQSVAETTHTSISITPEPLPGGGAAANVSVAF